MHDTATTRIHWSFWLITIVTLTWNAMGAMNYLVQMNPDNLASYPESHRAIIDGRPVWATAGFALAVFGGVAGGVLMLMRKSVASYAFIASLLGVVLTMVHTLKVVGTTDYFGAFEIFLMVMLPFVVAAFLVWYARLSRNRGWLK